MLETQSDVRLVIRDPDTPGGFKLSMAWRPASRSATAVAMLPEATRSGKSKGRGKHLTNAAAVAEFLAAPVAQATKFRRTS